MSQCYMNPANPNNKLPDELKHKLAISAKAKSDKPKSGKKDKKGMLEVAGVVLISSKPPAASPKFVAAASRPSFRRLRLDNLLGSRA